MSVHSVAANLLNRGVDLDNKKRYTEALVCYQEGIQLLVDSVKDERGEKRMYLRSKIEEYMTRAEEIKAIVKQLKNDGNYHEQIQIENNSKGNSYEAILGRFLDENVKFIKIEDPYIRAFHQCQNLLRFCELIFKKCTNIKKIHLITSKDSQNSEQMKWLTYLKDNLEKSEINMEIEFSEILHDRQITLSTGWVIKIGRGLDYFKAPQDKFSLGMYDLDLRPCYKTTIDIFHSSLLKPR